MNRLVMVHLLVRDIFKKLRPKEQIKIEDDEKDKQDTIY